MLAQTRSSTRTDTGTIVPSARAMQRITAPTTIPIPWVAPPFSSRAARAAARTSRSTDARRPGRRR